MIYLTQTVMHDPENGIHGDCMRTALACLLELPVDTVPHFLHDGCDGEVFSRRIDEFLETLDLALLAIPFEDTPVNVMMSMESTNPDTRFLLSGLSPRGINHVVVAMNSEIIHDPHPSRAGLVGPCKSGYTWVEFLVSRKAHK